MMGVAAGLSKDPGARFNMCVYPSLCKRLTIDHSTWLYNWDSYFISLRLLIDGQV